MKKKIFISFLLIFHMGLFAQWNTDRILTIGRNALYFEDYVLSIQYFNQVIKIKPFLAEPYMYRCIAKIQLGDFEGAEIDGTEAIQRNPFLPQAFYARGFTRMKLGKYKEAADDFTKALEFSPDSEHLLVSRMDAYERNGNYQGALDDIEAYRRIKSESSDLLYEKGRIHLAMKDTTEAIRNFDQLITLDSTASIGWSARALLKLQRKDLQGAYQDYSKAIQLKTSYFGDYINRGIINVESKRYMEALSDYDQAIKMEPESLTAYLNRAILRSNLGDDNNALSDFKKVLQMDSSMMEARYSKALLEMKLRNYKHAISDFNIIIDKHPYFLPAYWGISQAYEGLNNTKEAFRYSQKAQNLEKNKDAIQEKVKQDLAAKNMIAGERPIGNSTRRTDIFNRYATQNVDESAYESKYTDEKRGAVQKKFVDVVNEKNFVLSYYSKSEGIRQTNLYHPQVHDYNRKKLLSADLKITSNEIALTNDLINNHFEKINEITSGLSDKTDNPDIYFYRALEFALVQDFESAIEDLNKAISLRSDFMLAYFTRANIRNKYIDYLKNTARESGAGVIDIKDKATENEKKFDVELVMRDFEKVNELQPDFPFSYYNKANILCTLQDFRSAIFNYTKAIEIDNDFAEAYFNRGLTYLYIGEDAKGLSDLSKAGELGIYGAYNLIQRFK
ncbi:MAG: tetratricopeptide repeat protein [Paludibacter sp.]|nr:tetratricopeptide repeat protein [Paludibacter sp.]